MGLWLVLLFVVVPALELALLIRLFSLWHALLLVAGTGVAGAMLARHQGLAAWRELRQSLARGQTPERALLNGACVLVGAALLITPGLLTDLLGLCLLIPPTRAALLAALQRWLIARWRAHRQVVEAEFTILDDDPR